MEDDIFSIRRDMLPTQDEVFEFVNSRVKKKILARSTVVWEMALLVQSIWTSADTCPQSVQGIIKKFENLFTERRKFLTSRYGTRTKNLCNKRTQPSLPREKSKRRKLTVNTDEPALRTEVKSLLDDILDIVEVQAPKPLPHNPSRKITLRCKKIELTPEQMWKKEMGSELFDIFSELLI